MLKFVKIFTSHDVIIIVDEYDTCYLRRLFGFNLKKKKSELMTTNINSSI